MANKQPYNFAFDVGGPESKDDKSEEEVAGHEPITGDAPTPSSKEEAHGDRAAEKDIPDGMPELASPQPPSAPVTQPAVAALSGDSPPSSGNGSGEAASTTARQRTRRRKPRARRPKGSYGMGPTILKIFALIVLAILMLTLHGTPKIIVVGLLLLGLIRWVAPRALDKILPKKHSPPKEFPKRRFRGLYWKWIGQHLHARLGCDFLAKRSLRQRLIDNDNKLWGSRWVQIIVAFCNKKGGSAKTAICVWLIALYAHLTNSRPLAFDVNENGGHTAARLGVKRDSEADDPELEGTIELRPYLAACERGELGTLDALTEVIDWHRETGVIVIASDKEDTGDIDTGLMTKGVINAKHNAKVVFADCGNNLEGPGNLVSMKLSGRLVFCGNSHMAGSTVDLNPKKGDEEIPDDLMNTMNRFIKLGHEQQVKNGIIVIIGKKRDRKKYAEHYKFPLERVFVIPYNRYMAAGKVVGIKRVPLRILVVLSDILVAIFDEETLAETPEELIPDLEPAVAGAT